MGFMDSLREIKEAFTTPVKPKFAPEGPAKVWTEEELEEEATIFPEWGYLENRVAGVSFYQPQIEWACAYADGKVGNTYSLAKLEFDPTNQYDKRAIKVTIEGHTVGHIPKDDITATGKIVRKAIKADGEATCVAEFFQNDLTIPIAIRLDLDV